MKTKSTQEAHSVHSNHTIISTRYAGVRVSITTADDTYYVSCKMPGYDPVWKQFDTLELAVTEYDTMLTYIAKLTAENFGSYSSYVLQLADETEAQPVTTEAQPTQPKRYFNWES
jgi:hypothetical protein